MSAGPLSGGGHPVTRWVSQHANWKLWSRAAVGRRQPGGVKRFRLLLRRDVGAFDLVVVRHSLDCVAVKYIAPPVRHSGFSAARDFQKAPRSSSGAPVSDAQAGTALIPAFSIRRYRALRRASPSKPLGRVQSTGGWNV